MKVFMYEDTIVNLEAVEYIFTSMPDNRRKVQTITFHLRNNNTTAITLPIPEVQRILKEIYDKMKGE